MNDSSSLLAALVQNPGNWKLRIQAAEALISEGKSGDALKLLKQSVDAPISLVDSRRLLELTQKLEASVEAEPEAVALSGADLDEEDDVPALAVAVVAEDDEEEETVAPVAAVAVPDSSPAILSPAAVAISAVGEGSPESHEGDDSHEGRSFIVLEGEAIRPHEKESDAAAKISAISTALLVHVVLALLLSLAVIAMPRPNPPQVTATISQPDKDTQIDDVKVKKITRAVSSSTSASPSFVVSAVAASPVAVPEFDGAEQKFDVTLGAVGGNIGVGMSFEAGEEESMVNFFGIKSKGSRIVFVIEAARFMLTDSKGGIPAYDKVKEDIEKMLAGLNKTTAFNIVLFEGKKIASYKDELVAASPSNVRQAVEWLMPINQVYEELGIRTEYTTAPIKEGVEPIPVDDLVHYTKALQRALEMDVNTVFLLTSGWVHFHKPLEGRELEKFYRDYKWTEKDEEIWVAAVKRAQAWLDKENAARRAKGVPQRVIRDWHEIVAELEPNVRRKPGPGYTMEEVEEQVKNAKDLYYRVANKKKPEINIVWFIGDDEEPSITVDTHFKNVTRRDGGELRVLKGLAGLKNVTGNPE
ncbi:MAG: hypothetical protein KDM64_03025 [Verrucomicrobiae bacterium]|nr:hypothetical protein [Verrucomicrobiae bacterium]